MGEWWVSDTGENMLAGLPGSYDNPARLPDDYILNFLICIPDARKSFDRLIGNMLPEEQERLRPLRLASDNQRIQDPGILSDMFMTSMNRHPVYSNGTRAGGNR